MLDLRPTNRKAKSKKKLTLLQAYSKKYFLSKLKPIADSRYQEHLLEVNAGFAAKLTPLDHRNRIIKELWAKEPEDVKQKIEIYREHRLTHGASSDEKGSDEDDSEDDSDEDDRWEDDTAQAEGTAGGAKGKGKQKTQAPPSDPVEAKAKVYHE